MFINYRQGQIITTVVVEGATCQYLRSKVSWLFITEHTEVETTGVVEREREKVETAGP